MGGRVAEKIVYNHLNSGAANDLEQATSIARRMVREWGMSDKVGRIALSSPGSAGPFLGRELGLRTRSIFGQKILGLVDSEVERLVNNAYIKAKTILTDNLELLHHLASILIEQEVVTAEEFQMMLLMFNAKVVDYKVMGDEQNREKLPFQHFPERL